ncbi:MAG: hypothetical protein MI867_25925 [Pseudomonadales bacterium]|nr:hypothetical protein [Pseudomonadales bacterium]
MKKILIVGAGAVGQVYGYQFAQAGNQVSFFAKEKYHEALEQGLTLYHLNRDKKKIRPINFDHFEVLTTWQAVAESSQQKAWDQIYLCISSTALLNFDFEGLRSALNSNTTVVMLQPGPKDYALAAAELPESQIVQGMITLISYDTPLPGESVLQPGVAYWLPPMAATPFSGPGQRCADIIKTFKQSNMNATSHRNLRAMAPYPTAALMAFLTALEASDWKLDALKNNKPLQREMIQAQRQAFNAISEESGNKAPLWKNALAPWMINFAINIAPKAVPLDLETYFQVHFTKVKDQTKLYMSTYIESAEQQGLNATELISLNQLTN